jgi:hypothetical protein
MNRFWNPSWIARVVPVAVVCGLLAPGAGIAQVPRLEVRWAEERLSVEAQAVPRAQLLEEVVRVSGRDIRAAAPLDEIMSVSFSDLLLEEAVTLLGGEESGQRLAEAEPALSEGLEPDSAPDPTESAPAEESPDTESAAPPGPDAQERLTRLQDWLAQGGTPEKLSEGLQSAAQDPEVLVRELALRQLRERDSEAWCRTLDAQLGSEDVDLRRSALQLLAETPDSGALARLHRATEDENVDVRAAAFEGLAQLAASGGLDIIRERLRHADPEVRLMAFETLASQGGDYAMEAARIGLTDLDEEVRSKAEGLLDALRQP